MLLQQNQNQQGMSGVQQNQGMSGVQQNQQGMPNQNQGMPNAPSALVAQLQRQQLPNNQQQNMMNQHYSQQF